MKEIKAYIKPHKLSEVTLALHKVEGLTGLSVTNVQGFGRGRARGAPQRIVDDLVEYMPRVKLEIFCRDELVEQVIRPYRKQFSAIEIACVRAAKAVFPIMSIAAIEKTAHTGLRGDGKIYVTPVEVAVRISTGGRGEEAV